MLAVGPVRGGSYFLLRGDEGLGPEPLLSETAPLGQAPIANTLVAHPGLRGRFCSRSGIALPLPGSVLIIRKAAFTPGTEGNPNPSLRQIPFAGR